MQEETQGHTLCFHHCLNSRNQQQITNINESTYKYATQTLYWNNAGTIHHYVLHTLLYIWPRQQISVYVMSTKSTLIASCTSTLHESYTRDRGLPYTVEPPSTSHSRGIDNCRFYRGGCLKEMMLVKVQFSVKYI